MRILIISTENSRDFANKLKNSIDATCLFSSLAEQPNNSRYHELITKQIKFSDMIIVLVDSSFKKNNIAKSELQTAIYSPYCKQKLVPILLDGAQVPEEIKDVHFITCDSSSEDDYRTTLLLLNNIINKNMQKTKLKKSSLKSRTKPLLTVTLAIEIYAIMFVVLYIIDPHLINSSQSMLLFLMISLFVALIVLITSYSSIMKKGHDEDLERETESYSKRLKEAIIPEVANKKSTDNNQQNDEKPQKDALGRMLINLEDIKEFYTWSQKQAKASFKLAVGMCIGGLILIVAAILLPILFKPNIQVVIISATGGIITEFIAATALFVYRSSLVQLNHYHKALHEDERFLSSVNLIGKFNTFETQDEMLKEIIRSEIRMNFAELNDKAKDES